MDASLYFQLVDAIASARAPRDLSDLTSRLAATHMHPLERRVLERALRTRAEALDLHDSMIAPASRPRDLPCSRGEVRPTSQ